MIRKILVLIFLTVLTSVKLMSQELPVIDLTNIGAAIENGITMYNQLQQAYNQTATMVKELNAIIKDMASFDTSKYDWSKWDAILHMTDHYMDQMDRIEAIIHNKDMQLGNVRFSLADLYETNVFEQIKDDAFDKYSGNFTVRMMTDEERAEFFMRHGLSYNHYKKLENAAIQIGKKAEEVMAKTKDDAEYGQVVEEQIKDFTSDADLIEGNTEGLTYMVKQNNLSLRLLNNTAKAINDINQILVNYITMQEMEIENSLEVQNMFKDVRNAPVSKRYMNMGGSESDTYGPSNGGRN